ncbi:MAG: sulfate/molybdate ABC transporter ATP-binding protein [Acidimicrobiia bacterium]
MRQDPVGLQSAVSLALGSLYLEVELDVGPGETVALLGPNGAGKTTLLRVLAGLQSIDAGRVVLDGIVLDGPDVHVPVEARPVGFVFQDHLLFPHLSALENVAFGLRSRGLKRSEARRRALEWLERVGLAQYASSRPRTLSGGQSQRVALARALATEPRLLLLDEPLAALDASTRLETRRELRRQLAGYEGVRLIVTHDLLEAASLAERLVVIEVGRVVQSGTLEELSRQPRSRYVADLVGVNLLRGRAEGDRVVIGTAGSLVVPGAGYGEVFAVVHPRAVALYRQQPAGTPRNVWQGVAESLDLEGERVRVKVGGPLPIVAEVTPAAVADLGLAGGGPVWVSVKATEISVYPV